MPTYVIRNGKAVLKEDAEKLVPSHYINRSLDFVTDNITGDPVRVTSKRQHEQLCKDNNVTPSYGKGWW